MASDEVCFSHSERVNFVDESFAQGCDPRRLHLAGRSPIEGGDVYSTRASAIHNLAELSQCGKLECAYFGALRFCEQALTQFEAYFLFKRLNVFQMPFVGFAHLLARA